MKQSRHHVAEVIGGKTLNHPNMKKLAQEIAAYLLHEKQAGDIDSLMRDIEQFRADNGVIEATTVSVSPLPDAVLKDVSALLKAAYPDAKHITVRQRQDPDVIGGIRIDLANEQLDMSVKAKLNMFKRLTALERK